MEIGRKDHELYRFRGLEGLNNLISVNCGGNSRNRSGSLACLWGVGIDGTLLSSSLNHMDMVFSMDDGPSSLVWKVSMGIQNNIGSALPATLLLNFLYLLRLQSDLYLVT